MTTDELAAMLLRHPGLPVEICIGNDIEPLTMVELDCFDVNEGQVVVLVANAAANDD